MAQIKSTAKIYSQRFESASGFSTDPYTDTTYILTIINDSIKYLLLFFSIQLVPFQGLLCGPALTLVGHSVC